ncbi:MAG: peptidoglycan-binding protein [Candidatus Omnitrophica bacterium]|nr:peptidoglycan-binding protein [Candidatus Omnitrophota bacterium]
MKTPQQMSQSITDENSQWTYQRDTNSFIDSDYEDALSVRSKDEVVKKVYSEPIKLSHKQIQQALKKVGFYQGAIDGKIGPKTKEAIIKFQKFKGLKIDGIVGKRTSAELNKYLSR